MPDSNSSIARFTEHPTALATLRALRESAGGPEGVLSTNGHGKTDYLVQQLRFPFTLPYQQKLLALLIQQRKILPIYAHILKAEHFTTPLFQDTAEMILALWQEYGVVPSFDTLKESIEQDIVRRKGRLPKGIPEKWRALLEELEHLHVPDAKIILAQLIEWIQEGAVKAALVRVGELIDRQEQSGEKNYGAIRGIILDAMSVGVDTFSNTIRYFDDLERRMHQLIFSEMDMGVRIPLVLPQVDNLLEGGPSRGEMTVWVAPTSRGKTWALLWAVKAALYQGKRVALITTEQGKGILAQRMDRSVAQMTRGELRENPDLARKRITNLQALRGELFITECLGKDATVERVHAALEQNQAETGFHPDIIVVDYPGTMYSTRKHGERRHEIAEIYRDIRSLGKEWDAVIHTAMQTSKGSLSRKIITIRDLAECFEVAWHSDIILALCQTGEEEREGLMRIFLAKNREGRDHYAAPFFFNKETGTFTSAGEAIFATEPSLTKGLEQAAEQGVLV